MLKFIKKIAIFILLFLAAFLLLAVFDKYVIGNQYKLNYQASLIDKVERLENIDKPKIILVGNSNVAFGFDSKKIEEEMNMPVVNLGLHAGLGNAYLEQIAKLSIDKGDIVIISHSNFSDQDKIDDTSLAWITYDYNDFLLPIIRKQDYFDMLRAYPQYMRDSYFLWLTRRGNLDSGTSYSRKSFNKYGDAVYRPEDEKIDIETYFKNTIEPVPEINNLCTNRINELNDFCENKGAKLYVAGYPIAYGKYANFSEKDFNKFQKKLESELKCKVISNYKDYFYPYELFYNGRLHLSKKGAEIRTNQLIKDLKIELGK